MNALSSWIRPPTPCRALVACTLLAGLSPFVPAQELEVAPRLPVPPPEFRDREKVQRMVNELIRWGLELETQAARGQTPSTEQALQFSRARAKVAYVMAFVPLQGDLSALRDAMEKTREQLDLAERKGQADKVRGLEQGLKSQQQREQQLLAALRGEESPCSPKTSNDRLYLPLRGESGGWREVRGREVPRCLASDRPAAMRAPGEWSSPFGYLRLASQPLNTAKVLHPLAKVLTAHELQQVLRGVQERLPDDELGIAHSRELGALVDAIARKDLAKASQMWDERWNWVMAWEPPEPAEEVAPERDRPRPRPEKPVRTPGPDRAQGQASASSPAKSTPSLLLSVPAGVQPQKLVLRLKAEAKAAGKPRVGAGRVEGNRLQQLHQFARSVAPEWSQPGVSAISFAVIVDRRAAGPFTLFFADVRGGLESNLVRGDASRAAAKLESWIKADKVVRPPAASTQRILAGLRAAPAQIEGAEYEALATFLAEGRRWLLEGSGLADGGAP